MTTKTVILVAGTRHTIPGHERMIQTVLKGYDAKTTLLLHGGAPGIDTIAARLAKAQEFEIKAYPAEWHMYGLRAGPIRNQKMIDAKPDQVFLLPYPSLKESKGTYDTYKRALAAQIPTTVLLLPDPTELK